MKHKLIPPANAVAIVQRLLQEQYGFFKLHSSGHRSAYLSKRGLMRHKIRVSDHHARSANYDVCHEVLIDQPTILADIEYRAKAANAAFVSATGRKV